MPGLRDFLERFRPAGAPGAAARRGVPSDRRAEANAELAPLLALLDDVEERSARIRREAVTASEHRRADAARRAEAIVADARSRAEAVRAEAAARVRRTAEAEVRAVTEESAQEAGRLRERAGQLMPEHVDRAVAAARALLAEVASPDGGGAR